MHEEILSWNEMCGREGRNLQAGMHFRSGGSYSVLLMSTRKNAPYPDAMAEGGTVLIYVGHDAPRKNGNDTALVDQPRYLPKGGLTQNGKFHEAAQAHKQGNRAAERVRVYEKLRDGLWADNGWFLLVDSWQEDDGVRLVFKFKLVAVDDPLSVADESYVAERRRMIPPAVKLAVWKRDSGRCVQCGSTENLHFDHIIPWSRGGASDTAENVQLLCGRHNIQKGSRIE
jgi:hypothetical protein